jgi:diguanylate cyclase (GGDEF)-like protein
VEQTVQGGAGWGVQLHERVRNDFSGRRPVAFRLFMASVAVAGVLVLGLAVALLDLETVARLEPVFWALCALLLAVELRPLFTAGARDPNGYVLTTAFVFAVLLRYGFPLAVVVQAVATLVSDVARGRALWRTAFNVGQYSLSWAAAALVMSALGHRADPAAATDLAAADLGFALLGGLTYFVVNQALVCAAVSLKVARPWCVLVREDLGAEALSNAALLALSPLIVLAAEAGLLFLPLLLPPLLAVYSVGAVALEREQQALTDGLTGLPNRALLARRTATELSDADAPVALLVLDLDRFKEVNDTLGHHVGDDLLKVVARRLLDAVRPTDTVARLGGDEFAVLLPGTDAAAAELVALRLLQELDTPILLDDLPVEVRGSIGLAAAPEDGDRLEDLLRHADVAMYLAKQAGGGVQHYDARRDSNSTTRFVLLAELRSALASDEIEVHYQPQADLATGRVTGVEALVRWRHPSRGMLMPDAFLPLVEHTDFMTLLTRHVLRTSVRQLAAWRAEGLDLRLAVNVTARDVSGDTLVDDVCDALARAGVPAGRLLLEVTEASLFADADAAARTVGRLEQTGVVLALDDFGTGWSSLDRLRSLPLGELKVDRTFVRRMVQNPRDAAIVRSVVDLAVGLHMRVVAEGVSDEQTCDLLREMGCDEVQGWWLSPAQPARTLTPWLHERARRPAPLPSPRADALRR